MRRSIIECRGIKLKVEHRLEFQPLCRTEYESHMLYGQVHPSFVPFEMLLIVIGCIKNRLLDGLDLPVPGMSNSKHKEC